MLECSHLSISKNYSITLHLSHSKDSTPTIWTTIDSLESSARDEISPRSAALYSFNTTTLPLLIFTTLTPLSTLLTSRRNFNLQYHIPNHINFSKQRLLVGFCPRSRVALVHGGQPDLVELGLIAGVREHWQSIFGFAHTVMFSMGRTTTNVETNKYVYEKQRNSDSLVPDTPQELDHGKRRLVRATV